jgi:hypothetical protein
MLRLGAMLSILRGRGCVSCVVLTERLTVLTAQARDCSALAFSLCPRDAAHSGIRHCEF